HEDEAVRMTYLLRDSEPLLPVDQCLAELAKLGERGHEQPSGHDGGKARQAEALASQISLERTYRFAEKALGIPIVGPGEARGPPIVVRHGADRRIPESFGHGARVLAELPRLRQVAGHPRILAHIDRQPSKPPWITERSGQTLGFSESGEHRLGLPPREECAPEADAEIQGRPAGLTTPRTLHPD